LKPTGSLVAAVLTIGSESRRVLSLKGPARIPLLPFVLPRIILRAEEEDKPSLASKLSGHWSMVGRI